MVNVLTQGFSLRWASAWAGVCLLLSLNAMACPVPPCHNDPPYRPVCSTPSCYRPHPSRSCNHPRCGRPDIIPDESIAPPEEPSFRPDEPLSTPTPHHAKPTSPFTQPTPPPPSGDILEKLLAALRPLVQLLKDGLYQLLIALIGLLTDLFTWLLDPQHRLFKFAITLSFTGALYFVRQYIIYAREVRSWAEHTANLTLTCPYCKTPAPLIGGTYNRYRCQEGHQFNGDPHRL
jgi:hypothetical protein